MLLSAYSGVTATLSRSPTQSANGAGYLAKERVTQIKRKSAYTPVTKDNKYCVKITSGVLCQNLMNTCFRFLHLYRALVSISLNIEM